MLNPISHGEALWDQAYKLLAGRLSFDQAEYHRLAVAKANEIRDFLGEYGAEIDASRPDIVTELGKGYDGLVKGASDTLAEILPSPAGSFVHSLLTDETSVGDALKAAVVKQVERAGDVAAAGADAVKKAGKPLMGWLIGGAVFVLGALGIWAWGSRR